MRIRVILKYTGSILEIIGALFILPIVIGLYYGETFSSSLYSFFISSFVAILSGYLLSTGNFAKPTIRESVAICVFSWIGVSLVSSIPFIYIMDMSFIDSFFESVSGFTTTGITVMIDIESTPHSLLFWRALTQWLGGVGILGFFLIIVVEGSPGAFSLFSAESHKIEGERISPGIFSNLIKIWKVYIGLSFLLIVILLYMGMGLFDALTHTFTCVSTGGFSNYNSSIAYFNEPIIEIIFVVFMFLGGTNFLLIHHLLTGDIWVILRNQEFKLYALIIIISSIIIGLEMDDIRYTVFQTVSLITSTGYETSPIRNFGPASQIIFLVLMIIGGCVGSTAGGVKVLRISVMLRICERELKRVIYPYAELPVVIEKYALEENELSRVMAILSMFMVMGIIGTVIIAYTLKISPLSALSISLSALGNMGPVLASSDVILNAGVFIKSILIVFMLAGRLEIIPLLVILKKAAWKPFPGA